MTEEEKMTIVIKKPMRKGIDLQSMVDKIRDISFKKRFEVTYSTNKEDRRTLTVEADTYTGAYLAFLNACGKDTYVIDIQEMKEKGD